MKGYDVTNLEYASGHELPNWRGGNADGLKQLLNPARSDRDCNASRNTP